LKDKDTFSRAVKEELARVTPQSRKQAYWEMAALTKYLRLKGGRKGSGEIPTEPFLARRLLYLMKQCGMELVRDMDMPLEHTASGPENSVKDAPKDIFREILRIEAFRDISPDSMRALLRTPSNRRAFLRGAFLARGSISSPSKNHHLEIALPTYEDGVFVSKILEKEGLKGGLVRRRSSHVAYLKDADGIAEFLRLTGASQAVLDYENVRARKSLMSSVLRVVNMDRANVSRAVEASMKQLADIRLIDEEMGLGHLPAALRELARTRLAHPDLTMEELGHLLSPPASKSAVNHRFRRIAEIADEIRKKKSGEGDFPA